MNTHWRIRIFISPSHIASSYAPKRGLVLYNTSQEHPIETLTRVSLVFLFFSAKSLVCSWAHFPLAACARFKIQIKCKCFNQPVHYAILMLKYKYWNCIHRYKNKINIINLLYFRLLSHKSPQICNSILI